MTPRFHLSKLDAVDWLRSLPDESVDLVVTDPAYESLEKHRKIGTTTRLTKAWFPIFPNERYGDFFRELYRVLRNDRHAYVYCDAETMFIIKPVAEAAGFKFWKPLVWDKVTIGMGYHYRARYEFILFFEKGKRKLRNLGAPDILTCSRIRNGYPTEKPVAINTILIDQSSTTGELVADPFLGSGSTGFSALCRGCNFIGTDVVDESIDMATQRLHLVDAYQEADVEAVIDGEFQRGLL